jgi:hypothetical protein
MVAFSGIEKEPMAVIMPFSISISVGWPFLEFLGSATITCRKTNAIIKPWIGGEDKRKKVEVVGRMPDG